MVTCNAGGSKKALISRSIYCKRHGRYLFRAPLTRVEYLMIFNIILQAFRYVKVLKREFQVNWTGPCFLNPCRQMRGKHLNSQDDSPFSFPLSFEDGQRKFQEGYFPSLKSKGRSPLSNIRKQRNFQPLSLPLSKRMQCQYKSLQNEIS